ncbi:response regulator transcription factor [Cellulomonas humilata]|uniref:DNA-binding CsgD family transcriptional regulator n=1 Tax=Cellulomonas humilata TaxID=144055 RepID=A0ABU0EFL8_9CELL|nr:helix-turn-helix transcriptional regulator [Cellulomonas humilata]MDQ0373851.1 DNA-binding CsgD family transcriptional regulator [Cellulomonas humilata]
MEEQQECRRWLDLTGRLLSAPLVEPAPEALSVALAETFAASAGTVQRTGGCCRIEPLALRRARPVDVRFYSRHALDAPLLRHFRRWPGDEQVRSSDEVDPCVDEPATASVVRRLRDDGLRHGLAFPVPGTGRAGRRWWVVARVQPFGPEDLAFARSIHALVVGLDQHAAAMRSLAALTAATTSPPDGGPSVLTEREHAVLVLMEQGLIATAIGHRLGVSSRTVSKHQGHIYRKLGTTDRLTAVLQAQRDGLLGAAEPVHG